jgi:hypothetical protein
MEDNVQKKIEENIKKEKETKPHLKKKKYSLSSNTSNSLAENIKTQEQADFFKKMLNVLIQEQKEREQQEK